MIESKQTLAQMEIEALRDLASDRAADAGEAGTWIHRATRTPLINYILTGFPSHDPNHAK